MRIENGASFCSAIENGCGLPDSDLTDSGCLSYNTDEIDCVIDIGHRFDVTQPIKRPVMRSLTRQHLHVRCERVR